MRKIKMGIVGLGRLGYEHAKNIAFNIPNAELIAVCSVVPEEVEKCQKEWGIPYGYTTYEEMLENKELEAVAILSPSGLHVQHLKQAFDAGLHVFMDKPLGVTVEECKEAEKIIEAHPDLVFLLGFMRRYDPSYAYAKELIKSGKIGTPYMVKLTGCDPIHAIEGAIKFAPTSGGIYLDMSVHEIDLARWFLESEVSEIYAIGGSFVRKEFGEFGDCDNACALMKFENGTIAQLHVGRAAPHGYQVETEIIGTKGSLRVGIEPIKNLCQILDETGIVKECSQGFPERFKEAYLGEMKAFVQHILEDTRPELTVYDGTQTSAVGYAATEALRSGNIVKL